MVLDGLNHGCSGISDTGGPMINYVWINPRVIQGWSVNSEFPPGKELKDLNHPTSYRELPHSFNRGNKEGKKADPGFGAFAGSWTPQGQWQSPAAFLSTSLLISLPLLLLFSTGWLSSCQFSLSLHSISHHCLARSFVSGQAYLKVLFFFSIYFY